MKASIPRLFTVYDALQDAQSNVYSVKCTFPKHAPEDCPTDIYSIFSNIAEINPVPIPMDTYSPIVGSI